MKKVFMSVAIVAMMIAASAWGNNNSMKAAEAEAAVEEAVEAVEAVDSTVAAAADTVAAAAQEVVEEVKGE